VEFEYQPYQRWKEVEKWLNGTESTETKEETKLELSERIVQRCHEIITKQRGTLAARRVLQAKQSIWIACNRVVDEKEPDDKFKAERWMALKSNAEAVQNWLEANQKKKQ